MRAKNLLLKLILLNPKAKKLFTSTTQVSRQILFKQVTKKLQKKKKKYKKNKLKYKTTQN